MPLTPIAVKEYTALITQSGTDAPTVQILNNTLGPIVWTYENVGTYKGTLTGAFPNGKTYYFIQNNYDYSSTYVCAEWTAPNSIYINVAYFNDTDGYFVLTDNQLADTPITIKVYN